MNNTTNKYIINKHNIQLNKNIHLINKLSTFQIEKNISLIYNKSGKLKCKLITKHIQYSDSTKTIYFVQPTAILFSETETPIWNIQSKKAKITSNKIMYLHGNVQITNLINHAPIRIIKTHTATLNLMTYEIFSNEKTTIYGIRFYTTAMNMRGNLKEKIATLSKKVYTSYEIQNI